MGEVHHVQEAQGWSGPDSEGQPVPCWDPEIRRTECPTDNPWRAGIGARPQTATRELWHRWGTPDRATGWKTRGESIETERAEPGQRPHPGREAARSFVVASAWSKVRSGRGTAKRPSFPARWER